MTNNETLNECLNMKTYDEIEKYRIENGKRICSEIKKMLDSYNCGYVNCDECPFDLKNLRSKGCGLNKLGVMLKTLKGF